MSNPTATYDTGEVQVRVEGPGAWNVVPAQVCRWLENAWHSEEGSGAWGEMTATFERGELKLLRTAKTKKP